MKRSLQFLFALFILITVFNSCSSSKPKNMNMIARMEVKEPIEGVCDNDNVLVLSSIFGKGQVEAVCSVSEDEMEVQLNEKVQFIKDNPDFEGEAMAQYVINCRGEVCRCRIDNKTDSEELNMQMLDVFKTFTTWKAGTYNGKSVDSVVLISFKIKDGKITFN